MYTIVTENGTVLDTASTADEAVDLANTHADDEDNPILFILLGEATTVGNTFDGMYTESGEYDVDDVEDLYGLEFEEGWDEDDD